MSDTGHAYQWHRFIMLALTAGLTVIMVWTFISVNLDERGEKKPPIEEALRSTGGTCVTCHTEVTGFSPFHNPAALGCTSCHLGDSADTTEAGSHEGMVSVPGNLAHAEATCGQEGCHPAIVDRVKSSMMATGRGIVAVDRYVFGEQATPDGTAGFQDLGESHADLHLQQMCSSCHLGYEKTEPGPITELSRGGGCTACHIQYHDDPQAGSHPVLTVNVTDDHCFGCHSRSGRISLNYSGWHETLERSDQPPDDPDSRLLLDGRIVLRQPEDVHHALDLACIDCHTARETMGDGKIHTHQNQAVEITCGTCHRDHPPGTRTWDNLDGETRKILFVRHGQAFPSRTYVTAEKSGEALSNVFLDEAGQIVLEGKINGRRYYPTPPTDACNLNGHERVSCQSCHSAWAPQCIGCHTQRDLNGQWREFTADFYADPPTLGVRESFPGSSRIEPFAPGMIMTLNKNNRDVSTSVKLLADEGTFHRLFAPSAPHTTASRGRTCKSCHNDPLALGYGRGTLHLQTGDSTRWVFDPLFAPERDGLPADAWIPFLAERSDPVATRTDVRPFNRNEQERILRVGTCLTCHDDSEENRRRIYNDFHRALARLTPSCEIAPVHTPR